MDTKYLRNVVIYILSAILAIGFIYYVLYHIFGGFSAAITTYPVAYASETEMDSFDNAYIFRDEKPIFSTYGGAINYLVSDGEKVGVASVVAQIYENEAGANQNYRVLEIDKKIELLQKSNIGENIVVSDISKIDIPLEEHYLSVMKNISDGNYYYAMSDKNELLTQINKRKIFIGTVKNYDGQIAALTAERAALTAAFKGRYENLAMNSAGYFYYDTDGYENIFSSKLIDGITVDEFKNVIRSAPENYASSGKNVAGKLVADYKWYVGIPAEKAKLSHYEEGKNYNITFSYNYGMNVSMLLERIVTEAGGEEGVLIFSSTSMPENFNYLRAQSVSIERNNVKGYRIPVTAVRNVDGKTGVYILYGSTVYFRRVDILIEREGYFIVKERDSSAEDAESYLGFNDTVITGGKDLYDGKIIG